MNNIEPGLFNTINNQLTKIADELEKIRKILENKEQQNKQK